MSDDSDSSSTTRLPDIAVTVLTPAWRAALPEAEMLARRAARGALAAVPAAPAGAAAELSIALADDATLARLNRTYRQVEGPTNVLAFAADPGDGAAREGPALLGDVVLAFETVRREAAEQGKGLADHLCHLVVHGVLHLLGYDHLNEPDAAAMERLETEVLARLGIADPYREEAPC